jgi:hypothetical protein
MVRTFLISTAAAAALLLSETAFAQGQFGTADEAKTMLLKAVAAVKADKAKALDMFAKGEGGFKDRDLYPFCFNLSDGKVLPFANPNGKPLFGQDERTLKDAKGFAFGQAFWDAAQKLEGQVTEVSYVFPKPGADPTPVAKTAFITKAGDLGCGVGYYK